MLVIHGKAFTTIEVFNVLHKFYRPATFEDGIAVVNNLRKPDRDEILAAGSCPNDIPIWLSQSEHPTAVTNYEGQIAGVAGVVRVNKQVGVIWLLCTPAIETMPIAFFRKAHEWMENIQKDYTLLWNHCDVRNKTHHRLLKFLGFTAINKVSLGPDKKTFYEIVKLCVDPSPLD